MAHNALRPLALQSLWVGETRASRQNQGQPRQHPRRHRVRRVRRIGRPFGVSFLVAEKRNPKIEAHGGYMLRDDDTFEIVFGNAGYDFSASLEEVEEFLLVLRIAMRCGDQGQGRSVRAFRGP